MNKIGVDFKPLAEENGLDSDTITPEIMFALLKIYDIDLDNIDLRALFDLATLLRQN